MRQSTRPRIVFRIVRHDPPVPEDFTPASSAGAPPHARRAVDPRLSTGISVLATERQALARARRYPGLGTYVAELELPANVPVERTLRTRGHHTVWADPDELLRAVRRVIRLP